VKRDNAPEAFGVFRHVAINALRKEKTCKKGMKDKRFKATLQSEHAQKAPNGIFLSTYAFSLHAEVTVANHTREDVDSFDHTSPLV